MGYYMAGQDIELWGEVGRRARSASPALDAIFSGEKSSQLIQHMLQGGAPGQHRPPGDERWGRHPTGPGGDPGYGTPGYGWGGPRMNVANPVAFRRAARRVNSFARAVSKMLDLKPRRARARKNPFARKRRRK